MKTIKARVSSSPVDEPLSKASQRHLDLIAAAENYYNYACKKQLSEIRVGVSKLQYDGESNTITLSLMSKISFPESCLLKINGVLLEEHAFSFISYDEKTQSLKLRPNDELFPDFSNLAAKDIIVISDLRFLIKRVWDWHIENSFNLCLPKRASVLKPPASFEGTRSPSDNQKEAIENIFTSPFSYIWGPPGTGKTTVVLSQSIMHYIKNMPSDGKILLCAPTNNALEQSLSGILPMLKENGIPLSCVCRLGIPSESFRKLYPECCEGSRVDKTISQLEKEIKSVKAKIKAVKEWEKYSKLSAELTEAVSLRQKSQKAETALSECLKDISAKTSEFRSLMHEADMFLRRMERLSQKRYFPFVRLLFPGAVQRDRELIQSLRESREYNFKRCDAVSASLSELERSRNELVVSAESLAVSLDRTIEDIKSRLTDDSNIGYLVKDLNRHTLSLLTFKVQSMLPGYEDRLEASGFFADSIDACKIKALEEELKNLSEALHRRHTSDAAIENARLIACTVDKYCQAFPFDTLNPIHIFVDEAAFLNLCKALCLFTCGCPVTLLGDHMQLPPVFEGSSSLFEKKDYADRSDLRNVFFWDMSSLYVEDFFSSDAEALREIYVQHSLPAFKVIRKSDLTLTYRFSSSLADILDKHVYRMGLRSAPDTFTEIVTVDAPANTVKDRVNTAEIDAIEEYIKNNDLSDFAIITPYKNQVAAIQRRFPLLRQENKVMTIHKSQGREWDTVILSVVDTSDFYFTNTNKDNTNGKQVMNTAVSRARKRLVVVCDKAVWEKKTDQLIHDLILPI